MKKSPSANGLVLLTVVALVLAASPARAQIPISALGSAPYAQDFDSLSNSPASGVVNWTNNLTLPGWYASRQIGGAFTNYQVDVGAVNTGRMYSYGSTNGVHSVTERALGLLGSGTPRTTAMGVRFANDTTNALTNIVISYTGEQWRNANGQTAVTNILTFWYQLSNTPIIDSDPATNSSWTSVPELNFKSPYVTTNAGASLDGNVASNRVVFTNIAVPNLVVSPGQELFLRWLKLDDAGSDAGLAVDDLTVSFDSVPFAPPAPVIVSLNTVKNDGAANNPIGVRFDQTVDDVSAADPANYVVNAGAVTVVAALPRPDGRSVELKLASAVGEFFSVCATNIHGTASGAAPTIATGFPSEYSGATIGVPGDPATPGQIYSDFWDSHVVTASGSGIGGSDDRFHFVYQEMAGDFDARVLVTHLGFADSLSQAGLMARESLDPSSASLQTYFTPTQGVNQIDATVRPFVGVATTSFLINPPVSATPLRWLRITRSGDVFTTYEGTNGVTWNVSGTITQSFKTNLLVGMAACSHNSGLNNTASFTDFSAEGGRPGDDIRPVLSAGLSGSDVVLEWPATPRSYAVEIATDLSTSNQWGLLSVPYGYNLSNRTFELRLPAGLMGEKLFLRNTRVDKLIPDIPAIMATAGIILSPGAGLAASTSSTLCSSTVTNAYTQTNSYVAFTNATTASAIDSLQSSSSMNTVLQVRNVTTNVLGPFTCNDDAYSLETRSRVLPLPGTSYPAFTKFTFVVGVKTTSTPKSTMKVYITP